MILSGKWCLTRSGEHFLLADESCKILFSLEYQIKMSVSGDNKERILIFGSRYSIEFLSLCSRWHVDGIFLTQFLLFA